MKFFAILALILILGYTYLGFRLTVKPWEWLVLLIPFALVMIFPLKRDNILLLHAAFTCMGILTYLLVFTLLRDAVSLVGGPTINRYAILFLAVFTVVVGMLKATKGIRMVRVEVPVRNLSPELEGFKIAQISDLHIGATIGKKFVSQIVERTNNEKPDIVVFTGDIGDASVKNHLADSEPLSQLKTNFGMYYVPGNHEYYHNASEWMARFESLGMKVLINDGAQFKVKNQNFLVAGVPDPASGQSIEPERPLRLFQNNAFRLLLSHRPEVAERVPALDYDLILEGHTHGGQFFPWTLVAMLDHRYYLGLYKLEKGHIYVSAGTGSWGPLLRLGTTSEITILELKKAQ